MNNGMEFISLCHYFLNTNEDKALLLSCCQKCVPGVVYSGCAHRFGLDFFITMTFSDSTGYIRLTPGLVTEGCSDISNSRVE